VVARVVVRALVSLHYLSRVVVVARVVVRALVSLHYLSRVVVVARVVKAHGEDVRVARVLMLKMSNLLSRLKL